MLNKIATLTNYITGAAIVTSVLAIMFMTVHMLRVGNRFPFGTGISTWEVKDRVKKDILYWLDVIPKRHNATKVLKKYYRQNGSKLSNAEVGEKAASVLDELLKDIAVRFPKAKQYIESMPEVFVKSENKSYKKAIKDFNASSYEAGSTGIEVSYIIKYLSIKDEVERAKWISLIAQIIMHEASHHQFRLNTGKRITKKHAAQLIHHINEYYADLRAFDILGVGIKEAVSVMEFKAANCTYKDPYKTYTTHPSQHCRQLFVSRGRFDANSIIWAADMININKGKSYIKGYDIRFVTERISEFEQKYKGITMEFSLDECDICCTHNI